MFFRREREKERGNVHTERRWAHILDTLQAREEARTGVCEEGKKKTLHQVWQTQISVFNCCFGVESRLRRGWTAERKEMDTSWLSVSEQCLNEWLPSYHSSIIRQLNTCCLQMLNKIKLSYNDLRVHIPLLLYNLSFARLDTFCMQFFFFFFKWSNLLLSDRCAQAY